MPPLPVAAFAARLPAMTELLRTLVEMESPSTEKKAIDRLGGFVAEQMAGLGAAVQRLAQASAGDHWIGQWGSGGGGFLLLAHLDTVYPLGTLASMPWREEDGRAYGPGVLDMKASVAMALTAIEALRQAGRLPDRRLTLLCTSDEEVGSRSSRGLIERLAAEHDLTLCLEPSLPDGALKTQRKGVGVFYLETRGRAAHAGAEPEKGINAIVEMAHQVLRVSELGDGLRGTTLNVGVVQGGTRSNVVPDVCRARVDLRADTAEEAARVQRAMASLAPVLAGATISVEGGLNRPPMPRTAPIARAFEQAKAIGARLGLQLREGATGGGSDANFLAPLDLPVLDGLGAVGESAHSEREQLLVQSLVERAALLAALITDWQPTP
jgi:glutamate carboxypeptidase